MTSWCISSIHEHLRCWKTWLLLWPYGAFSNDRYCWLIQLRLMMECAGKAADIFMKLRPVDRKRKTRKVCRSSKLQIAAASCDIAGCKIHQFPSCYFLLEQLVLSMKGHVYWQLITLKCLVEDATHSKTNQQRFCGAEETRISTVFFHCSHPYRIVGNKLQRNYWTSSFYIKKKTGLSCHGDSWY